MLTFPTLLGPRPAAPSAAPAAPRIAQPGAPSGAPGASYAAPPAFPVQSKYRK